MADRAGEGVRLMSSRFTRWLAPGELVCPELALKFLDQHGPRWVLATKTGNTYALWKGMVTAHSEMDWSALKQRADAGFAEIRSHKPKKPCYRRPKLLSVPLAAWPPAFRSAWEGHLMRKRRRTSRLDEPGMTRRRSATEATAEHAFAEFVGAMTRAGRQIVVTRDNVQEFIRQKRLQRCQPRSIGNLLAGILKVARLVGVPDLDWLLATSLAKKSERDPRQRSKPMVEPGDVVHAGMSLIADARAEAFGSRAARTLYRDGLLLVLTAHFPFRRKNLSEARLGQNVVRLEDGSYRITFSVWEMKAWNEVEFVTDLPLARLIDDFLVLHRPWFIGEREDLGYLFPSAANDDGRLGGDGILRRFKKHSQKLPSGEFGCHDVRRHVASAVMRKNGDARAVAALLQHEGLGTVNTYARLRDAAAASREMRKVMTAIRESVARNSRAGAVWASIRGARTV